MRIWVVVVYVLKFRGRLKVLSTWVVLVFSLGPNTGLGLGLTLLLGLGLEFSALFFMVTDWVMV
jgi:hypothetical protein